MLVHFSTSSCIILHGIMIHYPFF